MTIRQPPRFAGRLLKRLVPAQDHDALLGDLNEEYQRGRSVGWYCLQIVAAIVVGSWRDIRSHCTLAVRATVVGFVAFLLLGVANDVFRHVLTGGGFVWHGAWIGLPWYWHHPYSWSFYATIRAQSIVSPVLLG